MAAKSMPESQITPYLAVKNAAEMIEFYQRAFGAIEVMRLMMPDKRIGHAELRIGAGVIMLADEFPEMGIQSPNSLGTARSPVMLHLYVDDVDGVYKRAIGAGAISLREPEDQFYGDRSGQLKDPSGHVWDIAMHKEDVSPAEMQKRLDAMMKQS